MTKSVDTSQLIVYNTIINSHQLILRKIIIKLKDEKMEKIKRILKTPLSKLRFMGADITKNF